MAWEQAIDLMHPTLPIMGQQITVYLIQTVWTYILTTWKLRNQHLHQDAGNLSLPNYQQAVTTFYEQGKQLPPAAQAALFQCPLHEMLNLPPAKLQVWLECSHLYMRQQLKAAKT